MGAFVAEQRRAAIEAMAFGDLFLEDIRRYRETKLASIGHPPQFPLWGRATAALAEEMIAGGLKAHLTCVDPQQAAGALRGPRFDRALLAELPAGVDPCGENGEFHTCVVGGTDVPRSSRRRAGEVVTRDGFVFADLLPAAA